MVVEQININPSILVNSVSDSDLEFKEVVIGTVIHEAIHSMEDYKFDIDKDLSKFQDETDGLNDIDEVLEVLSGPFGKYIFEILVHSFEEYKFVKDFKLVTPGIRLSDDPRNDQSRVATPEVAIKSGSNYLVIGRPITQSEDPASKLREINGLI